METGITLRPCLGWQSQAATSLQDLPFPKLGVLWVAFLETTSCHNPRELHMSSTCWFPVGEGLGPSWDLGLVTGASMAPGIGCLPWVSGIKLFLLWHLIAHEKAQVTLLVLWAVVDPCDNIWHPEEPCFHLKRVARGRQAGWHLILTHEVLAHQ